MYLLLREYCGKYWCPPAVVRYVFTQPRPTIALQSNNNPERYGKSRVESFGASIGAFAHSIPAFVCVISKSLLAQRRLEREQGR